MKEKRNDAELKNRKTKRNYDYERRVSDIYFDLFFVFVAAGTFLWVIMHSIFDACIDSWKADPALNNFRYIVYYCHTKIKKNKQKETVTKVLSQSLIPNKRCSKACICGNKPNQTKNMRSYFCLAVLIT